MVTPYNALLLVVLVLLGFTLWNRFVTYPREMRKLDGLELAFKDRARQVAEHAKTVDQMKLLIEKRAPSDRAFSRCPARAQLPARPPGQ